MSNEIINLLIVGGGVIIFGLVMIAFGLYLQKNTNIPNLLIQFNQQTSEN